jgi:hypothetical protein
MQLVKGSLTRPLAGVNGEVCVEKRKELWKERKKDLTRASIVRDGRVRRQSGPIAGSHHIHRIEGREIPWEQGRPDRPWQSS